MKQLNLGKFTLRSIVALVSASLMSSCAYDNTSYPGSPTNGRNGNDSAAPLLIGAAVVGGLLLAKRHKDKKREHNDKYHRGYDYNRNQHYGNHGNNGYDRQRDRRYDCDRDYGRNDRYSGRDRRYY